MFIYPLGKEYLDKRLAEALCFTQRVKSDMRMAA